MSVDSSKAIREASAAKNATAKAYRSLSRALDDARNLEQRGILNGLIWECAARQPGRARYFSQYGQDAYLDMFVFGGRRDGVFVEVGAFDGVTGSNSLYFEIFRGWNGLLIEAAEDQLEKAREFRRCTCLPALVGSGKEQDFLKIEGGPLQMSGLVESYDPDKRNRVERQDNISMRTEVRQTERLEDILRREGIGRAELISLDIEGGEVAVLETFPFDDIPVGCWCIETSGETSPVPGIMANAGYERIERIGQDDIYIRKDRL